MSRNSIPRQDIAKLAKHVYGPRADYCESGGMGRVWGPTEDIDLDVKHSGPVDPYAPKAGRAAIGRELLHVLDGTPDKGKALFQRSGGARGWLAGIVMTLAGALRDDSSV